MPGISSAERAFLEMYHVPLLQELFNRVVDAYPRGSNGFLGPIQPGSSPEDAKLELIALHNLATFPLDYQRFTSDRPVLTERFRKNLKLVIDSLLSLLAGDTESESIRRRLECPPGGSVPERDLSVATTTQLWAVQVHRLVGSLKTQLDVGAGLVQGQFDVYTLYWMYTTLADMLGVDIEAGVSIQHHVDRLLEALVLQDRSGAGAVVLGNVGIDVEALVREL
ncbi:hypothetical protein VNI00_017422 [Paramarasmius palmivorus]|uniref:Uncharacterized protein n=1 Tax=Paramarasmius palmivorus TaxID=297713 RepID=A0AAW0B5E3_9AGAR